MRVAFIEPLAHMQTYSTDIHMILPEACLLSKDYVDYFRQVPGYKILDNGAAEGREPTPETWDALLNWAEELQVNEIVVPDVMGDSAQTQIMAAEFARYLDTRPTDRNKYNWMGVAHGNTMQELVHCITGLAHMDYINTLGLPRIIANNVHRYIRCNIMESSLLGELIVPGFGNGVHCLGSSRFHKEAVLLADLPVRSIDTSFVASMSLAGRDIGHDPWCKRPDTFWFDTYKGSSFWADSNHGKYLEWCHGTNAANGGD